MSSDRIYLISKLEFDNSENEIGHARNKTIVGFTFSLERAKSYISEAEDEVHKKAGFYRGYDARYYPNWTYEIVESIPLHTPPVKTVTKA